MTASAGSAASPASATLPGAERPLVLVVRFHARPGGEADLEARLLDMARRTTSEPGCLRYDIHHDETDASQLVLLESWADQESLDAHMTTAHVQAFLADLPGLTSQAIEMVRLRRIPGHD